jgi:hypothetical protein
VLHFAARLLQAIWPTLVIAGGVVLLLGIGVTLLRLVVARRRY